MIRIRITISLNTIAQRNFVLLNRTDDSKGYSRSYWKREKHKTLTPASRQHFFSIIQTVIDVKEGVLKAVKFWSSREEAYGRCGSKCVDVY